MHIQEVPSPIDLRNQQDAQQWAEEVNIKRPWRYDFFDYYVELIQRIQAKSVLELGSGPGFFAQHLLNQCNELEYIAFDFSEAMHDLSRQKLNQHQ